MVMKSVMPLIAAPHCAQVIALCTSAGYRLRRIVADENLSGLVPTDACGEAKCVFTSLAAWRRHIATLEGGIWKPNAWNLILMEDWGTV